MGLFALEELEGQDIVELGVRGWGSRDRVYAGTPGIWGLACSEQYGSL